MTNWQKFGLALVVGQLALVTAGALKFDFGRLPLVGPTLEYYGILSGAGNSYGFFSPGVYSQIRAQFDITSQDGTVKTIELKSGTSHESTLRLGDIIEQFLPKEDMDDDQNEDIDRSVAASLAGSVFGMYPDAKKVGVRIDQFTAVSMQDYRKGVRPKWEPVYSISFERAKAGESL